MKKIYLIMTLVCMMMVSFKPEGGDGRHEGHEYVDLGLSVKWATCNVGANSPEEYGNYYACGETTTKVAAGSGLRSSTRVFSPLVTGIRIR